MRSGRPSSALARPTAAEEKRRPSAARCADGPWHRRSALRPAPRGGRHRSKGRRLCGARSGSGPDNGSRECAAPRVVSPGFQSMPRGPAAMTARRRGTLWVRRPEVERKWPALAAKRPPAGRPPRRPRANRGNCRLPASRDGCPTRRAAPTAAGRSPQGWCRSRPPPGIHGCEAGWHPKNPPQAPGHAGRKRRPDRPRPDRKRPPAPSSRC